MLAQLAGRIAAVVRPHPLRVALDGIDAAGKTTLADDLAPLVAASGRPVIRASADDFQRSRAERYARLANTPLSYYEDAFDYPTMRAALLDPLGPGGDRVYRRAVWDVIADMPIDEPPRTAPAHVVLLFDGVFLLRPELAGCWDFTIFVEVTFEAALARAEARDTFRFGSVDDVRARYATRFWPAQRFYLEQVRPRERADAILQNDDPANPTLIIHT